MRRMKHVMPTMSRQPQVLSLDIQTHACSAMSSQESHLNTEPNELN